MIGETVGHYRIIHKIGQGGMGEVYLAEDTELQRRAALKFFTPALTRDEEAKKRFKREAQLAASLNHPNIVTIYEVGEHNGSTFIAMEYVEGRSLYDLIRECRNDDEQLLPLEQVLDIAAQICEGLVEAHRAGIIHRDLKSDNILIDTHGRVRILDFGLARLKGASRLTKDNTRMGTPDYMSPEQVAGGEIDQRSDVFSFGVVLYEMLTGERPFAGERDVSVVYAILNEEPPSPETCRGDIPPEMLEVVSRCLRKEQDERFANMEDILAILEAGGAGGTVYPRKKASYRRAALWGGLLTLAVFLIIGVVYQLLNHPADSPPGAAAPTAVAVLPFTVGGGDEYAYLGEGIARLLSTKLDGAGDLRSVDPSALFSYVDLKHFSPLNPQRGQVIARHFEAEYFITGNILEAGGNLSLEALLYNAGDLANAITRASVNGEAGQVFSMVDELAMQLVSGLVRDPQDRLQNVAAVTTHSLPALKAFLVGEQALRNGRYEQAMEDFRQAVSSDSEFALAYYRLSLSADWLTRPDLANQAAQSAVRHSHRLSEHDRLLLNAILLWHSGNADEAERLYRTIAGINRENLEAWFQLGEILFHYGPLRGQSISGARQAFQRVVELNADHVPSLWHLARIASAEGRKNEVETLVKRIQSLQPAGEREAEIMALNAFSRNDDKARQEVLETLRNENDYTLALTAWTVAVYTPHFEEAEQILKILIDPARSPEARGLGYIMLAHLYLAAGKLKAAQEQLDHARQFDPQAAAECHAYFATLPFPEPRREELENARRELALLAPVTGQPKVTPSIFFTVHNGLHPQIKAYLLGILDAGLGNENRARNYQQTLLQAGGQPEAKSLAGDLALGVEAEIALFRKRKEEALSKLEQRHQQTWYGLAITSPYYSRSRLRFQHAEVLLTLERPQEAIELYNSFSEYSIYDLIYVAPACRRLAEIYDRLGQPREAARYYHRFLELWQDCDPRFRPYLQSAALRLESLPAVKTIDN